MLWNPAYQDELHNYSRDISRNKILNAHRKRPPDFAAFPSG